jgi:hypothetical protein
VEKADWPIKGLMRWPGVQALREKFNAKAKAEGLSGDSHRYS